MTKKKKIAAQFFNNVEINDLKFLTTVNINDDKIFKHLESDTETNYNRMLILWNKWVFIFFSSLF